MRTTLALKYRPRTFSDLVGQRQVRDVLQAMVRKGEIPAGLLFAGVRGSGKTTAGRILAAALNCLDDVLDKRPCGACASCLSVWATTSMDVLEIDGASHGRVEDIRELTDKLHYAAGGRSKIVLLDEAQSMSREAHNALLKTLEEPPPFTHFVLLTTQPSKIIDTVLSRCMSFEFRKVGVGDIVERLAKICCLEGVEVEGALLTAIAEHSDGGMRDAVMSLDHALRAEVTSLVCWRELTGETDFAPGLLRALALGDMPGAFEIVEEQLIRMGDPALVASGLVSTLRDLAVLNGGGWIRVTGQARQAREELSVVIDAPAVYRACKVLWDLKTKFRLGDDTRAALELAVVELARVFGAEPKAILVRPPEEDRLTLEEMAALAPRSRVVVE